MDFASLEPALKAWARALLGWAATDPVVFENEPRPRHNGRIATLALVSAVGVGVDETRYEDTGALAPLPNLAPAVVGARVLAVQIAVETVDQRPGSPHARAALERLRARLRWPSSLAALAAANVALIGAGTTSSADYLSADKRFVARALLEVRLNASSFEADALGATGAIESVAVTSDVTTPADASLPPALQMVDETIP